MNPAALVAYLILFAAAAVVFVLAGLLVGRVLRPRTATPEKSAAHECGGPPVESGCVPFYLRFYVVALVFLVFEVAVAFFFPWAVVFGKAMQLADPRLPKVAASTTDAPALDAHARLSPQVVAIFRELGVRDETAATAAGPTAERIERGARRLALAAMIDLAVFFAVLLVGFAYVWHRGDLDWGRATAAASPPAGPGAAVARGCG